MKISRSKEIGQLGEKIAAKILLQKGYKIIERNFSTRYGEIDIVASEKGVLVFVEVKTRTSSKFGRPEEAVGKEKLRRIKRALEYYCLVKKVKTKKIRIDVLAIEYMSDEKYKYRIIKAV